MSTDDVLGIFSPPTASENAAALPSATSTNTNPVLNHFDPLSQGLTKKPVAGQQATKELDLMQQISQWGNHNKTGTEDRNEEASATKYKQEKRKSVMMNMANKEAQDALDAIQN